MADWPKNLYRIKHFFADAHIGLDGRVKEMLDGVLPKASVTKLVLQGKNPACQRNERSLEIKLLRFLAH